MTGPQTTMYRGFSITHDDVGADIWLGPKFLASRSNIPRAKDAIDAHVAEWRKSAGHSPITVRELLTTIHEAMVTVHDADSRLDVRLGQPDRLVATFEGHTFVITAEEGKA